MSDLQLSTLPEAIGRLSQLQALKLSDNRLSALPEAVQRLERLEELFLHGNPALAEQQRIVDDPEGAAKRFQESIDRELERERRPTKPGSGPASSSTLRPA